MLVQCQGLKNASDVPLSPPRAVTINWSSCSQRSSTWSAWLPWWLPSSWWVSDWKHRWIQFKVLRWIHFSKFQLSKIYPEADDKCDRCAQSPANVTHLFWSCNELMSFRSSLFEIISKVIGMEVLPGAGIAVFGVLDSVKHCTSKPLSVIVFSSLPARRRTSPLWKASAAPSASSPLRERDDVP